MFNDVHLHHGLHSGLTIGFQAFHRRGVQTVFSCGCFGSDPLAGGRNAMLSAHSSGSGAQFRSAKKQKISYMKHDSCGFSFGLSSNRKLGLLDLFLMMFFTCSSSIRMSWTCRLRRAFVLASFHNSKSSDWSARCCALKHSAEILSCSAELRSPVVRFSQPSKLAESRLSRRRVSSGGERSLGGCFRSSISSV